MNCQKFLAVFKMFQEILEVLKEFWKILGDFKEFYGVPESVLKLRKAT